MVPLRGQLFLVLRQSQVANVLSLTSQCRTLLHFGAPQG